MSLTKLIISIIVVVTIAVYGFIHFSNQGGTQDITAPVATPETQAPVVQTPIVSDTATPAGDVSDQAINTDLSGVDGQIKDLSTDAANVDAGLSDKPISQTESAK